MVAGNLLLLYALIAIIVMIALIVRWKLNPFVTLLGVSVALAAAAGMPMDKIIASFEAGVGKALGHIALVIALGTMLGKMMAESGGAERIARTLIGWFGERRVHWAMVIIALIVGMPVFFEVGFVLLVPIAFNIAARTGTSLVLIGLSMVAGLSVAHGLIPPHPAALLAVEAYHADIGRTILCALVVGLPTALLAGPVFGSLISRHVTITGENPMMRQFAEAPAQRELPGFGITVATILLPVALMLVGSWADLVATPKTFANDLLRLLGSPVMALLIAVLVSFWTFGHRRGFDRQRILAFTNDCLAPTATITLLIGAGAGFGRILMDSGISTVVIDVAKAHNLSPLIMGWTVSAMIRLATGSATVAMTTACGIVAPLAAAAGAKPELMVLSTGAGSLVFSHVNDAGFWQVKEYFHLTVAQTFMTWSITETIISVVGLLLTLALSAVLPA